MLRSDIFVNIYRMGLLTSMCDTVKCGYMTHHDTVNCNLLLSVLKYSINFPY